MNNLLENWRNFSSSKVDTEKYFQKAVKAADTFDDFDWSLADFEVKNIGVVTLDSLEEMVRFGEWVKNEPKELTGLDAEERIDQIKSFDIKKRKKAKIYLNNPGVRPPVVLVTAPDSNNDSFYTRIGYGKELINLHILLGLQDIQVYHLIFTKEIIPHSKARGLPGPPGRLYNS